jgi:hypothetical protein
VSTYGAGTYGTVGGTYADLDGPASGGGGGTPEVGLNFVPLASYRVYVGWEASSPTLFTFDFSTFDSAATMALDEYGAVFDGPHDDVTLPGDGSRLEAISVVRGRTDDLSGVEMGTCTVSLRDPAGRYDEQNTASPLFANLAAKLHNILVTMTFEGVQRNLFRGYVRSIEGGPRGQRGGYAQFECVDLFYVLADARPVIASTSTTTGGAIGLILDSIGFIDPRMRVLGTGDPITFSADGTRSALDLIGDLLQVELGIFYIDGNGRAVYQSRVDRVTQTTLGSLDSVMEERDVGHDADAVVNKWTVTRTGGTPQVSVDVLSQDLWNERARELGPTPYIASDSDAKALADYLVSRTSSPRSVAWGLTLRPAEPSALRFIADRSLGDRVTIGEDRTGTEDDYVIEQTRHEIRTGQNRHVATYLLDRVTWGSAILFDVFTFDSTDEFVY